jgi:RNA polymerase sigma-70 factor (ECF subfamily)
MTDAVDNFELIDRAVAGDRAALERLMLDHYAALARQIDQRMPPTLRSVLSADDLVQMTYTQVFVSISSYEPREDASFFAWLIAIAENRLRDCLRAHRRKKRGGGRAPISDGVGDSDSRGGKLFDVIAGSGSTPSQSVARREGIQAIQIAVAGLPDAYRQAVELRYFEGRSVEETAGLMGRTTGAVRGLLDRAKKELRDALERASKYLSSK